MRLPSGLHIEIISWTQRKVFLADQIKTDRSRAPSQPYDSASEMLTLNLECGVALTHTGGDDVVQVRLSPLQFGISRTSCQRD